MNFREKEKIFLFHQQKGKKLMVKEWFTVKECLELPGVPGSAPDVRRFRAKGIDAVFPFLFVEKSPL
ncbi:hypothetical protein E1B03_18590 [Citrobacter arsenatis]|uniref:Uncharacterized protein n=1 Tax=Citrobacter arsenatis TaxID=2546350 RepID=A0A4P6WMH9_9ENTR|nr:hypothetical protein E1B03_18590 [Citrobacter arsenatis]